MAKGAYIGIPTSNRLGNKKVGSIVKLKENGSYAEYIIVHQGLPSSKYDSSCNGTWLLRKHIYEKRALHSKTGTTPAYSAIDIHSYLNNTFINLFDSNVRNVILQAKIPYETSPTNSSQNVATGTNGISTKVFLLSCMELGFKEVSGNFSYEGNKLDYFKGGTNGTGNSIDNTRVAYFNGTAFTWWTRSPYTVSTACYYWNTLNDGSVNAIQATELGGIRPAIILSPDVAVSSDGSIDGSASSNQPVARKIKKGYIGVDGKARKIRKAYIGIGGVARPCWADGELTYYGAVTSLRDYKQRLAATSIGGYALFGGGSRSGYDNTVFNTVDAYNSALTRTAATTLSVPRQSLAAVSTVNHALFGGGKGSGRTNAVDAYNTSLSRSTPSGLSAACRALAAASIGGYALFGGGYVLSDVSNVDAYNSSLTKTVATNLSSARSQLAATSIGGYALFGGGSANGQVVDAYNTSLTRSTPTALSNWKSNLAATSIGGYALFGGGTSNGQVVNAYNASLTRSIPTELSVDRYNLSATSVEGYALFGGGYGSQGAGTAVDAYNTSLVRTIPDGLSVSRHLLGAATVGVYALFAGGDTESATDNTGLTTVDAYTVV